MQCHYLNPCWIFVNWTIGNKFQWNLNWNMINFIQENWFEDALCKCVPCYFETHCCNFPSIMIFPKILSEIMKWNCAINHHITQVVFAKHACIQDGKKECLGIVLIPVHSIPYMRHRHQSHYPSGLPMNIPYQTNTSGSFKTCKRPFSNQLWNNTGENLVFVEKILVSNQLQNDIGKHLISIEKILYMYISLMKSWFR